MTGQLFEIFRSVLGRFVPNHDASDFKEEVFEKRASDARGMSGTEDEVGELMKREQDRN